MREIKFRAWDKNKKVMTFVGELAWLVGGLHFGDAGACQGFIGKDAELMQYTGLKDCHGKDIYEGDIVYFKDWHAKEVIWEGGEGLAGFRLKYTDLFLMGYDSKNFEVIGNIYSNPELLKP